MFLNLFFPFGLLVLISEMSIDDQKDFLIKSVHKLDKKPDKNIAICSLTVLDNLKKEIDEGKVKLESNSLTNEKVTILSIKKRILSGDFFGLSKKPATPEQRSIIFKHLDDLEEFNPPDWTFKNTDENQIKHNQAIKNYIKEKKYNDYKKDPFLLIKDLCNDLNQNIQNKKVDDFTYKSVLLGLTHLSLPYIYFGNTELMENFLLSYKLEDEFRKEHMYIFEDFLETYYTNDFHEKMISIIDKINLSFKNEIFINALNGPKIKGVIKIHFQDFKDHYIPLAQKENPSNWEEFLCKKIMMPMFIDTFENLAKSYLKAKDQNDLVGFFKNAFASEHCYPYQTRQMSLYLSDDVETPENIVMQLDSDINPIAVFDKMVRYFVQRKLYDNELKTSANEQLKKFIAKYISDTAIKLFTSRKSLFKKHGNNGGYYEPGFGYSGFELQSEGNNKKMRLKFEVNGKTKYFDIKMKNNNFEEGLKEVVEWYIGYTNLDLDDINQKELNNDLEKLENEKSEKIKNALINYSKDDRKKLNNLTDTEIIKILMQNKINVTDDTKSKAKEVIQKLTSN